MTGTVERRDDRLDFVREPTTRILELRRRAGDRGEERDSSAGKIGVETSEESNPSPPSGRVGDSHPQAVGHARHTKKGRAEDPPCRRFALRYWRSVSCSERRQWPVRLSCTASC